MVGEGKAGEKQRGGEEMREEESSLSTYCLFRLLTKCKHNIQHLGYCQIFCTYFPMRWTLDEGAGIQQAERCHQHWKHLSRNDELLFILPEHSTATIQSSRQVHRQSGRRHRDSRLSRRPHKHDLPGFAAASTDGPPASGWNGQVMMNVL